MPHFKHNTLYYGDNLGVLRDFPTECVDLVYLDPPFNSNRSYNVLFRESKGTRVGSADTGVRRHMALGQARHDHTRDIPRNSLKGR